MINVGVCHPDVRPNGPSRLKVLSARDMVDNTAAALKEPTRLLVSLEIVPEASFVGLSVSEARQLARGLQHQAALIEQLILAKKDSKQH